MPALPPLLLRGSSSYVQVLRHYPLTPCSMYVFCGSGYHSSRTTVPRPGGELAVFVSDGTPRQIPSQITYLSRFSPAGHASTDCVDRGHLQMQRQHHFVSSIPFPSASPCLLSVSFAAWHGVAEPWLLNFWGLPRMLGIRGMLTTSHTTHTQLGRGQRREAIIASAA